MLKLCSLIFPKGCLLHDEQYNLDPICHFVVTDWNLGCLILASLVLIKWRRGSSRRHSVTAVGVVLIAYVIPFSYSTVISLNISTINSLPISFINLIISASTCHLPVRVFVDFNGLIPFFTASSFILFFSSCSPHSLLLHVFPVGFCFP